MIQKALECASMEGFDFLQTKKIFPPLYACFYQCSDWLKKFSNIVILWNVKHLPIAQEKEVGNTIIKLNEITKWRSIVIV